MTTIPEATKTLLKQSGTKFNRFPENETAINGSLIQLATRAVGNGIQDDKPYTIRINFQNGRIVGSEENPRFSVELLNGDADTATIGVPSKTNVVYIEFRSLQVETNPPITNGDSWVARAKIDNGNVASVFVNTDFSEEDRELIKTVLMRGFGGAVRI
jgi:hypothetical protein